MKLFIKGNAVLYKIQLFGVEGGVLGREHIHGDMPQDCVSHMIVKGGQTVAAHSCHKTVHPLGGERHGHAGVMRRDMGGIWSSETHVWSNNA